MTSTTSTKDRELVITRTFDAPRELVWAAWTNAEQIAQWFGPNGFTTTTREMEVRPGGSWRFTMLGPDGTIYPNLVSYREVVEPEMLRYSHGDDGGDIPSFEVTVTFVDRGGKTELTLHSVFASVEALEDRKKFGAVEGGKQTLGRLADYLAKLA